MASTELVDKPAPLFEAKAIASGRIFRLQDYQGKPVLLLFVDYNTGRETREVVKALRRQVPAFEKFPIALIVDMRIVPKLLRGTATRIMEAAYKQAASEVPPSEDPADHLILLPDWSGKIFKAYKIGNVNQQMCLVLLGTGGRIKTMYQGPNPTQVALQWLDSIFTTD